MTSTTLQSVQSKAYSRTWFVLVLLSIILTGALLRLYAIDTKTIWLDEAFSIYVGSQPVPELLRLIVDVDQHPPLYYLLFHFWLLLGGTSPGWARGFSALASIFTLPAIYLLARQVADRKTGLLAVLILAVSPFHITYGQEARTYALLTLAVTLASWTVARLVTDSRAYEMGIGSQFKKYFLHWRREQPGVQKWLPSSTITTDLTWLGYIVFTAAICYLHNTAFFFPITANLFIFAWILWRAVRPAAGQRFNPPALKNWILAQIGVFLVWSPWIPAFIEQARGVDQNFWIPKPTVPSVTDTLKTFFSAYLPPAAWTNFVWLLIVALVVLGIVHLRKRPAMILLLLAVFLTPVLGQLLVSLRRPIFYVRTLIWAPIPVYILMAAGIRQLRYRPAMLAAAALLVAVNLMGLRDYYRYYEKERWDQAASYVAQNISADDILLFNAGWVQIPFDYYFRSYNLPVRMYGAPATLFQRGELEPIMQESDIPYVRSIASQHDRIWLVYSHNWYTDPKGLVPGTLAEELSILQKRKFNGVEVFLYGVK